ncbi:SCO2400 family protein [Streptomyces sp. NPDC002787]
MDYCSSCRRHLNGALVCPGCGAYAPDIAPATVDSRVPSRATGTATGSVMLPMPPTTPAAPLPAATWEYGATGGAWHGGSPADGFATDAFATDGPVAGAELADASGVEDVDVDVEGVPAVSQGRAARRRQLARWKKNQRRAVVATAVALVGGGLTVVGMDRQSTDRTQAATAPDAETLGGVEEQGSQRGRTSATETDDTRRTSDTPTTWSPSGDTSRDRSAAGAPNSRAGNRDSPRTAASSPSTQRQGTESSTADKTVTDTATPTDEPTTPPATGGSGTSTDTSTGSGSGSGSGTSTGTDTGADSGSGTDSGTGTGTGTGTSDGSSSDTATTSPSGLCLLGIVCVS